MFNNKILEEIKAKLDDWREHVDKRTENNLNAAGSTMQRIVMDEVAKLRNAHDNILGNIHTLQTRLHNLDVKMNMILDKIGAEPSEHTRGSLNNEFNKVAEDNKRKKMKKEK